MTHPDKQPFHPSRRDLLRFGAGMAGMALTDPTAASDLSRKVYLSFIEQEVPTEGEKAVMLAIDSLYAATQTVVTKRDAYFNDTSAALRVAGVIKNTADNVTDITSRKGVDKGVFYRTVSQCLFMGNNTLEPNDAVTAIKDPDQNGKDVDVTVYFSDSLTDPDRYEVAAANESWHMICTRKRGGQISPFDLMFNPMLEEAGSNTWAARVMENSLNGFVPSPGAVKEAKKLIDHTWGLRVVPSDAAKAWAVFYSLGLPGARHTFNAALREFHGAKVSKELAAILPNREDQVAAFLEDLHPYQQGNNQAILASLDSIANQGYIFPRTTDINDPNFQKSLVGDHRLLIGGSVRGVPLESGGQYIRVTPLTCSTTYDTKLNIAPYDIVDRKMLQDILVNGTSVDPQYLQQAQDGPPTDQRWEIYIKKQNNVSPEMKAGDKIDFLLTDNTTMTTNVGDDA